MKIVLLASTHLEYDPEQTSYLAIAERMPLDHELSDGSQAELLSEFAGRLCYESFDRPNEATAHTTDYIGNIIRQQHFSVLEHASATFLIEGVSRSLTHELVRHRHFSYSQVSQRYVDHEGRETITPPVIRDLDDLNSGRLELLLSGLDEWAQKVYVEIVNALIAQGKTRKEARGAARAALLESTSTDIVVTGNHRAWRDFLAKRNSPHADQEIRELATRLLRELTILAPSMYTDLNG